MVQEHDLALLSGSIALTYDVFLFGFTNQSSLVVHSTSVLLIWE